MEIRVHVDVRKALVIREPPGPAAPRQKGSEQLQRFDDRFGHLGDFEQHEPALPAGRVQRAQLGADRLTWIADEHPHVRAAVDLLDHELRAKLAACDSRYLPRARRVIEPGHGANGAEGVNRAADVLGEVHATVPSLPRIRPHGGRTTAAVLVRRDDLCMIARTVEATVNRSSDGSRTTGTKEWLMIVVRNVFQLKFGKAREALAVMKEGIAIQKRLAADGSPRLLTDLTGRHYTLVLEMTVPNLAAFEAMAPKVFGNPEFQANYQKMVPLVESGHREIFTLVE